jgi:hypothetical protein
MMVRAITRRWPAWAVMSTPLLIAQPLPLAAQTDARAQREVRVLETVEPSTGRRSLHVMEGLSPDEIRAVQRALRDVGFGEPWRGGTLDPFTRGALQRFQTHRGLAVCACVSLETLIELDLEVRVAETIVLEEAARPHGAVYPPLLRSASRRPRRWRHRACKARRTWLRHRRPRRRPPRGGSRAFGSGQPFAAGSSPSGSVSQGPCAAQCRARRRLMLPSILRIRSIGDIDLNPA